MIKFRVILIAFLSIYFLAAPVLGQETQTRKERKTLKKQKKRDKLTNIEFIESNFSFTPKYKAQTALWRIRDKIGQGQTFNYIPNVLGVAGGQLTIKGISISYLHKLPVSKSNQEKFGNTEFEGIEIDIQTRVVGLSFYYTRYRGFYLDKPDRYDSIWVNGDNYPRRSDLQAMSIGLKTHFTFNKKFSMKAAFEQTERQKKSAGSFMMMFGDHFMEIKSDSSLIPISEQGEFGSFGKFSGGSFNTFFSAVGAGVSLIKGNFNFTPVLLVGVGIQAQFYSYDQSDKVEIKAPLYFHFRNSVGINGDNLFIRLVYAIEYNSIPFKEAGMEMYYMALEMSIGFRL